MRAPHLLHTLLAVIAAAGICLAADKGKPVEPFNGRDFSGWKFKGDVKKSQWVVGTAALDPANPRKLVCQPGGREMIDLATSLDIYTEQKFGDAIVEVEVMVPEHSNSGVYVMGEYEIQVLDSFGKAKVGPGDMGGLYGFSAPRVNASKKPGQWQKFVIEYRAPRFDAEGKKTANAKIVKVVLNEQVIQENVELTRVGGGGVTGREAATGPLMFQGNHGPVAYRNIYVRPLRPIVER